MHVVNEVVDGGSEIDEQVGLVYDHHHRLEQSHVGVEVPVAHVAHIVVVGGEDIDSLEDGAVLDDGFLGLLDGEDVSEAFLEEEHLEVERPSLHVLIVIGEVGVVDDALHAWFPTVVMGEHAGERCLSAAYVPCNDNMHYIIMCSYLFRLNV